MGGAYFKGQYVKFAEKGMADIIGILQNGGRFFAIETKSEKGKLSKEQIVFKEIIEAMGGVYILARSLDDVIKELEKWR